MNTDNNESMVADQHVKAGRPTKYSPETVERLLAGLTDGLPIKSACIVAGIGVSTLSDWREKYPELEERMAEAREKARLTMLQRIKRAAEDDWRAAAEFLRLSFPADYRRGSNTSVEVNTAVQTGVVITEEQRMRLVAQRNRILGLDEEGRKIQAAAPVPAQETQSSGQQERQGADTNSHAEPSHPLWWITVKPAEPEPKPEEG